MACPSTGVALPSLPGSVELETLRARRDLVHELHQTVDDALGAGRASGDVDVDGNDRVDPLHGGVIVVEPARTRAHAERYYPLRLTHLIVDPLEHRRHLVADRADDEQHVGLARRETREARAEAIDVVVRARRRHVLHAAARGDERVLEDRVLSGPADGLVEL